MGIREPCLYVHTHRYFGYRVGFWNHLKGICRTRRRYKGNKASQERQGEEGVLGITKSRAAALDSPQHVAGLMSRFPTLTLTLHPHFNGCVPTGVFQKIHYQIKPFSKGHSGGIRLTSQIFFCSFFCCCRKVLHKVTTYFAMPRCVSFTYRGYTSITGRMYPFKNCSN